MGFSATFVGSSIGSAGTGNVTLGTVASVGDLIEAFVFYQGLSSQVSNPTISDNLNSGNYTVIRNEYFAASQTQYVTAVKVANVAGAPQISATGFTGTTYISGHILGGFNNTPQIILPTDITSGYGTGTAADSGGFYASYANEFAYALGAAPNQFIPAATGWSLGAGSRQGRSFIKSPVAQGTLLDHASTLPASDTWYVMLQGIYDAGPLNASHIVDQTSANSAGAASLTTGQLHANQGDFILVLCAAASGATLQTPTSSGSLWTFTPVFGSPITVGSYQFQLYYSQNCAAGGASITGSVASGTTFNGVLATQYTGVLTSGALLASINASPASPGAGANTLTTGTATVTLPSNCPGAILVGFAVDVTTTAVIATAGTSPVQFNRIRTNGTPWSVFNHRPNQQDIIVTASGNYAATYSPGTGTADTWFTCMVALGLQQMVPNAGLLVTPGLQPGVISGINSVLVPAVARGGGSSRRVFVPKPRRNVPPLRIAP